MITLIEELTLEGYRTENIYKIILDRLDSNSSICLKTTLDESWLWHRRLCHASMSTLKKITRFGLVRGVPSLEFSDDRSPYRCRE